MRIRKSLLDVLGNVRSAYMGKINLKITVVYFDFQHYFCMSLFYPEKLLLNSLKKDFKQFF